jgi:CxxC motif-containing protein (DUF1111 family)
MTHTRITVVLALLAVALLGVSSRIQAQLSRARDPGVRGGPAGAGGPLPALSPAEREFFADGQADFMEAEGVGDGLGPRLNLDSCAGCHIQPAVGGSSPGPGGIGPGGGPNPQVAMATAFGARNNVPSFIKADGPVREARFPLNPDGSRDGGVHALFVISGRKDTTGSAAGCNARQEDFERQVANRNIIFRIPTPTFGAGLIEMIPDSAIKANLAATAPARAQVGIHTKINFINVSGDSNNNGNDGTISRFGWKAQNKSLLLFSGEAYNVEMGITNELFQSEREEDASCQFAAVPNDVTANVHQVSAIELFAGFMRFLAPPTPVTSYTSRIVGQVSSTSIARGRQTFSDTGCALCHTPSLKTGNAGVAAMRNQPVNLYSDLALHQMGSGLADNVIQNQAAGDEFRTAPLWGLGQRIFFLHDGRTDDLMSAIQAHKGGGNAQFGPSEANQVVDRFNNLRDNDQQDILNFLRSL